MSVNRVTTRTVPEEPDGIRTPLRGREAELAFVEARLDALDRGEGGIVRVEGPAGIGRSRFLAEAAAAARRRGTRVFEGAADPDEHVVPLGPFLHGVLADKGPLAGAVGLQDLATTPGQRFWLLQELGDRLRETVRNGPLLVVLDDLQCCDDLTLLTFHTLAAGLSSHAILWLVAVRGGRALSGIRTTLDRIRQAGAHELALEALGDRATAQITEDVLGAAPDPDVLDVARRAEGVPQLLVELLGSLRADGAVTIENGTTRLSAGPPAPRVLPSVERRIGQLSEEARELVRTAARVGRPVTVGQLAELCGRPPAALITALQETLDADLLAESADRLTFRHDLIRETVRAGVPLPLPAAEPPPGSAASAAERPDTAAGTAGRDTAEARRLRTEAAELAPTAPGPAAERCLKALELTPAEAPERARTVAETIPLLWQTGRAAQARQLGASALAAGGLGPEDEALIRLALARLAVQFDFSEAVRQARAGADLPGTSPTVRGRLLAMLAVGLSMSGEHATAEQVAAEAWETAAAAGDRTAEATLTTVRSAVGFHRMDLTEAFRQAERSAALADALGVRTSLWLPEALWHALLANTTGRTAEALALADEGIRITREQGRTAATRMWLMTRTRVLLETGRLADARADAEAASPATGDPGPGNLADVTLRYVMLRVALHAGDRQTAAAYAAEARRMRSDGAPVVRHFGAWMLALMADFEGRPDHAMAALDEVMTSPAVDRPAYAGLIDPADAPVLVRMALRAGRHERAARAVALAEQRALLNPGLPFLAATAAHARGLLDNDLTALVRAVRLYEDSPRVLARASALEDAGRKLAATRRPEAVPYFETALALCARSGAERDAARVRRRLRAAGVRRRPSAAGLSEAWPELTAAETRVVRLVARELTNQQVAERLSLSPHTVGSHLRRAFTKLDVTSRAELSRLAERRDSGE
ncbi:helix-turn-helix transcriptional regulator [Streptomyces venezuelae]|uniref:helix-turn-helix transcriptional regulator n=1 Tax=Streptomyces venezuelae TaxID=54571 RepID=UPI00278BE7AA|nr:LuxR family transcriptional regulator [Streptomyces venezuelae]